MTWNIVTLPRYAEWTLDQLLSADEVTWPNNTWHQAELADLITAVIPVSGLADDGQPIVTPVLQFGFVTWADREQTTDLAVSHKATYRSR
jgi:hypothetical protein